MGLKIKKIEKLKKKEYAYDLCTSEGNRTFELDNGVVTHNSLKVPAQFFGFCLRGNTMIPLLNGETVSIEEMYEDKYLYIGKGIMGCAEDGSLRPTIITNIALTRPEATFIRVQLDNDKFVDVTDNHQMMLRDGSFIPASQIVVGDKLMPLNPDEGNSREVVLVEYIDTVEPAYDITVEDSCHTFALDCGIFVHNCDDSTGFNGGTSLSIISSRYAKSIKRLQNTVIQALTDVINLMLLDKGLTNYVNKFNLHMVPPTTQDEITRRDNKRETVGVISDVMNLLSDVEDASTRLKIVKSLASNVINDGEVEALIQTQIDKLESLENAGVDSTPPTDNLGNMDVDAMGGVADASAFDTGFDSYDSGVGDIAGLEPADLGTETGGGEFGAEPDMSVNLPTPAEMGMDMTDNSAF